MSSEPLRFRQRAEELAAPLPGLLAEAEHLAATIQMGEHGRRRSGAGDEFWQYRPAMPGDPVRLIDWRRSARSDIHFVRQREWQAMQSVRFWADPSQSMNFASSKDLTTKARRARLLVMATAILLQRGGERVGLLGDANPPSANKAALLRMAETLFVMGSEAEYGAPDAPELQSNSQLVLVSDFLGDLASLELVIERAMARGLRGAMVQVLDPMEVEFPFEGRTVFQSIGGSIRFETQKANALKSQYSDRLKERQFDLKDLAKRAGWLFETHLTDTSAASALMWIYQALERGS
ncbi:DUF58 domain-containing protein [Halocynthiibacter sp. C4]|uniref:DUF58 domain-containing protein n=1 Tax=Halocynthiibacter sp. C4 TaxID=2992758 RepID=UPI00237AE4E7|nr:DUF58 domain-containing protein [Halocynthiibacter sp. C4]MDE0590639.1 DUF58 domain-containing protein [Halocynthiibacter sp. C4]